MTIAVMYTTLGVVKIKPEKNFKLEQESNPDLAIPPQAGGIRFDVGRKWPENCELPTLIFLVYFLAICQELVKKSSIPKT